MRSTYSSRYRALIERLQQARREKGLTQVDVARIVGRPQSFVSKTESGERRVDAIELQVLADLYGRPLSFFVAEGPGAGGASITSENKARFGKSRAARGRTSARKAKKTSRVR
jgi:transcriptional regulator with XRE-family HTH domain